MGSLRSLLFAGERVDAETGVALGYTFWFGALPAIVASVLGWVITHLSLVYMWVAASAIGALALSIPMITFVACLEVTILVMLVTASRGFLVMGTSSYVLTTLRVMSRTGIVKRRVQQVELRRVSAINVRRPLMGRLLRYGHVSIDSGNVVDAVVMRFVHDPQSWAARIRGAQRSHLPVTAAYENTPESAGSARV